MISIDRYLVSKYNITELLDSCHYRKEFFLICGVIMLGTGHVSLIESNGLALLGYDCANLQFGSISNYFKRSIEVRVGQQYFTSYDRFDSIKTLLVLVFSVVFDVFGS